MHINQYKIFTRWNDQRKLEMSPIRKGHIYNMHHNTNTYEWKQYDPINFEIFLIAYQGHNLL